MIEQLSFMTRSIALGFLGASLALAPVSASAKDPSDSIISPRDSVIWSEADLETSTLPTDALEHKGEQMGLIGPIVATGGKGRKAFIAVYDPAGVLVGSLSKKDADKEPQRLVDMIRVAQERGRMQNLRAMVHLERRQRRR